MKITWYGHSCFLVETEEGSAVFDPYSPGSVPGLELPPLTADAVICSHGHGDHAWREGVKESGQTPGFALRQFDTWHDGLHGVLRGKNTVTVLEAEGLRAAHLGDLGHQLSAQQLEELGAVDVLMLPVGGHFTIGAETAWELAAAVRPRILIPMHYRGKGFGYPVIATVDKFLELAENVRMLESNVLDTDELETPVTAVLRCPVK